MKATYDDFLSENPICSGLANNPDAKEAFAVLSRDANIIRMLEVSDQHQPALAACVSELEAWHDAKASCGFPLQGEDKTANFNRTAVGRMVKTILAPFGYEVYSRKAISTKYGSQYFSSASCYRLNKEAARLTVKKVIVLAEHEKGRI